MQAHDKGCVSSDRRPKMREGGFAGGRIGGGGYLLHRP